LACIDPYQNNISQLPQSEQLIALDGLLEAAELRAATPTVKPVTFEQWIDRNVGKGIGEMFMHPYNFKVWGVKTSEVSRVTEDKIEVGRGELMSMHGRRLDRCNANG
jgi:protoporphyrinogen oxidase